jgi:hypothetical protein
LPSKTLSKKMMWSKIILENLALLLIINHYKPYALIIYKECMAKAFDLAFLSSSLFHSTKGLFT